MALFNEVMIIGIPNLLLWFMCAVMRRSALEEIGGIAVETVTEDAHTALKLQRLGLEFGIY